MEEDLIEALKASAHSASGRWWPLIEEGEEEEYYL